MQAGDVVAGRFDVEVLAGAGGMGTVWRARDRHTGGQVAVKVVQPGGAQQIERFAREARVLAELAHPAIVRYVAHGIAGSGEPYLAMEWLSGEDLSTRLARSGLTVWESVALAARVAEALASAHGRGIVHRDMKPSNIFLVDGLIDRAKVLDFGIAHFGTGTVVNTRTGVLLGTPGYMAPEQARGASDVDARADVYSVGCVLFECLTGRPPVVGDHVMAVLAKILLEEAPRVSDLVSTTPPALDDFVARMLSKDRALRPANCGAILDELAALSRGVSVTGSRRTHTSARPPGLTAGEMRFVSLVVAAAPRSEDAGSAPTLAVEQDDAVDDALKERLASLGARLERLADGSLAAALAGNGSAVDQTTRAARCALVMRKRLADVPIVLATGRGVIGGQLPVGDIIDRAAALLREESVAPVRARAGRAVRIDQVTAGLLDARFDVGGDAGSLVLRAERESAHPVRTLLGMPTACVGRERELGALLGLLDECAEEPLARAALITSPPGIGKSRLLQEFLARLRVRGDDVEVWLARGDPISAGSPFGLLAQAVRSAAGLREGEPAELRRSKLTARVGRRVAADDVARVSEFLGELVGTAFPDESSVQLRAAREDPVLMGDQLRRAWEDFLAAECAAQPVILALDDLQWGDLPTVQFVDAALRNLHDRPFFVLALARPEVSDLFPRLWSERAVQSMPLGELTRRASEKLVRQVLGDAITPEAASRVVEQAAGNALYLEELIRAVADGRGDAAPETVVAMVQTRLESLPDEARRVLRAASVFGQTFWRGSTVALLGGAQRTTQANEWLDHLVEREVIVRREESKFPQEEEFAFRHTLVREGAYAMLTHADRALGHRLAGEWLEKNGEVDAVTLAEHFERGAQPGRALASWQRAAKEALEGGDFAAAIARAERGVACGARDEALGALRALQAEAQWWAGANAEAVRLGSEAMQLLPPGSAPWNAVAGEVAEAANRVGMRGKLLEVVDALYEAPTSVPTLCSWTAAGARAGVALLFAGQQDRAEQMIRRIEERSADASEPIVRAWLERLRAWRGAYRADLASGLGHGVAAASFAAAGNLRHALREQGNLGYVYLLAGSYALAERVLREALDAATRMGLRSVEATARQNLGLVMARLGRLEEARALAQQAVTDFKAQADVRMVAAALSYLADIELSLGLKEDALAHARGAVDASVAHPPCHAQALAELARVALSVDQVELALGAARQAKRILDSPTGVEEGHVLIRLVFAEALHRTGDLSGAQVAIEEARRLLLLAAESISDAALARSFLDNVPENARTLELAGEWLGPPTDRAVAVSSRRS